VAHFLWLTVYIYCHCVIITDTNKQLSEFVNVLFSVKQNGCMMSIMFRGVAPVHILLEFFLASSCSVLMEN